MMFETIRSAVVTYVHVRCVALQFSQALADLETAQSLMTAHVKSHADVVKQVHCQQTDAFL